MSFGGRERGTENRHGPCDDEVARGRSVPKRDSSAGFRWTMLSRDRPQQTSNDGALPDAAPASVALVPMAASEQRSQASIRPLSRPSSIFVTHLIATAEQAPQTRSLRRATPADAQTAYQANRRPVADAGFRTRQLI